MVLSGKHGKGGAIKTFQMRKERLPLQLISAVFIIIFFVQWFAGFSLQLGFLLCFVISAIMDSPKRGHIVRRFSFYLEGVVVTRRRTSPSFVFPRTRPCRVFFFYLSGVNGKLFKHATGRWHTPL